MYYDRSFIVETKWTPFFGKEDRLNLYKVIHALLSLTSRQWGFALFRNPLDHFPLADKRNDPAWTFHDETISLNNGVVLRLKNAIFHHHGLIGRGTQVFEAEIANPDDAGDVWKDHGRVVVKFSWVPTKRRSESLIIKTALDMATNDHAWVKNHLPNVLHTQDLNNPGHPIEYLKATYGDRYEERSLRVTVFEKLEHLATVDQPAEFLNVVRHIFACKCDLIR
jgi:hypothetical protein